jgi:hypothetical protein
MFSKKVLLLAHDAHFGIHKRLRSISKTQAKVLRRSMCMSFFVKCPKQRPVQGRFKKVQMYGALEDKDMVLCTILKRPITVNV